MKKSPAVPGTLSKLFGKKHASPTSTSLFATNPPWIFTQEAPDQGARDFGELRRGGEGGSAQAPGPLRGRAARPHPHAPSRRVGAAPQIAGTRLPGGVSQGGGGVLPGAHTFGSADGFPAHRHGSHALGSPRAGVVRGLSWGAADGRTAQEPPL